MANISIRNNLKDIMDNVFSIILIIQIRIGIPK